MKIITDNVHLHSNGHNHIIDITGEVDLLIKQSGMKDGCALVSAVGSTTGITSLEFEPGLVNHDIAAMLDKVAPYGMNYEHNKTWGDDNGAAHLRSALVGTSQTYPFQDGRMLLGTWQQVVFMDFDTRPRERTIVVQLTGQ